MKEIHLIFCEFLIRDIIKVAKNKNIGIKVNFFLIFWVNNNKISENIHNGMECNF